MLHSSILNPGFKTHFKTKMQGHLKFPRLLLVASLNITNDSSVNLIHLQIQFHNSSRLHRDTGLWLVESDHLTWILVSDWLRLHHHPLRRQISHSIQNIIHWPDLNFKTFKTLKPYFGAYMAFIKCVMMMEKQGPSELCRLEEGRGKGESLLGFR